jgi:hypothetical protein
MRPSPNTGKDDCHILDFVDAQGRVAGTFSTPSLFGLDPHEMTPGILRAIFKLNRKLTDSRGDIG